MVSSTKLNENILRDPGEIDKDTDNLFENNLFTKISIVQCMNNLLNAFTYESGISDYTSPATIVQGEQKFDMSKQSIAFVSYELLHIQIRNSMRAMRVPGISLL